VRNAVSLPLPTPLLLNHHFETKTIIMKTKRKISPYQMIVNLSREKGIEAALRDSPKELNSEHFAHQPLSDGWLI
jgi:hypothetical protein